MIRLGLLCVALSALNGCVSMEERLQLVERACEPRNITFMDSGGAPITIPQPNPACDRAVEIAGRNEPMEWARALSPLAGQALALGAQAYQQDQALEAQLSMHALDTRLANIQGRQSARLQAAQIRTDAQGDRDQIRAGLIQQRGLTELTAGLLRDDARADRALLGAMPEAQLIPTRVIQPAPIWPPGLDLGELLSPLDPCAALPCEEQ